MKKRTENIPLLILENIKNYIFENFNKWKLSWEHPKNKTSNKSWNHVRRPHLKKTIVKVGKILKIIFYSPDLNV